MLLIVLQFKMMKIVDLIGTVLYVLTLSHFLLLLFRRKFSCLSQKIMPILFCWITCCTRICCSLFISWRRQRCRERVVKSKLMPVTGDKFKLQFTCGKIDHMQILKIFIGRHLEMIDTFLNKLNKLRRWLQFRNIFRNFSEMLLMVIHVIKRYTFLGMIFTRHTHSSKNKDNYMKTSSTRVFLVMN